MSLLVSSLDKPDIRPRDWLNGTKCRGGGRIDRRGRGASRMKQKKSCFYAKAHDMFRHFLTIFSDSKKKSRAVNVRRRVQDVRHGFPAENSLNRGTEFKSTHLPKKQMCGIFGTPRRKSSTLQLSLFCGCSPPV